MTLKIPKDWLKGIPIPFGAEEGNLAQPCLCGYPMDFEGDEPIHLIQWNDGRVMFCHEGCIISKEDRDAEV